MIETTPLSTEQLLLTLGAGAYHVVIFNNDHTNFDDVVETIARCTACSLQRALELTLQAHQHGSAVIFYGSLEGCEQVARKMNTIGVETEVRADNAE